MDQWVLINEEAYKTSALKPLFCGCRSGKLKRQPVLSGIDICEHSAVVQQYFERRISPGSAGRYGEIKAECDHLIDTVAAFTVDRDSERIAGLFDVNAKPAGYTIKETSILSEKTDYLASRHESRGSVRLLRTYAELRLGRQGVLLGAWDHNEYSMESIANPDASFT